MEAEESDIARGEFCFGRLKRFGCLLSENGILFVSQKYIRPWKCLRPESCTRSENYGVGRALRKASLGQPLVLQIKGPRPITLCHVILMHFYSFYSTCLFLPSPKRLRGFFLPTLEGALRTPVALPTP